MDDFLEKRCGKCKHWHEHKVQKYKSKKGNCDKIVKGTAFVCEGEKYNYDGYSFEDECYDDCFNCFEAKNELQETTKQLVDLITGEQLKPCPFCGSENVYIPYVGGKTIGIVYCPDCGLYCTITKQNGSVKEITDKWNRRFQTQQL